MGLTRVLGRSAALVSAFVLSLAPLGASAQDPGARRLALANQIIEVSGGGRNWEETVFGLVGPMMNQLFARLPDETRPIIQEFFAAAITKMKARSLNDAAKAYAETFSEVELQGILTFNQSPAGQAMITKTPELARRIGQNAAALQPEIRALLAEEICARIDCTPQMRSAITGA